MTQQISQQEKLKIFKTAEEQLQTRIHNSKGDNIDGLINTTFNTLDIETLASAFVKERLKEMEAFKVKALSIDPLDRIKAREILKKDRDLEQWTLDKRIGFKLELEKLREEFKATRQGRIL